MIVRLVWGVGGNAESYSKGQVVGVGSTNSQRKYNMDSSAGMMGKGSIIWMLLHPTSINC